MKAILGILLLCASLAYADVPADRAAIQRVVNSPSTAEAVAALLTTGAEPWSEVTPPHIAIRSIRFLTPEIALVDADSTQIGSTATWRVSVWLVMKKAGGDWKIASLRLPEVSDFV
jgi:hypothetical protein